MQNLNFNAVVKEKIGLQECPICVIRIFFMLDRKLPLRLEHEELQKPLQIHILEKLTKSRLNSLVSQFVI